MRVADGRIANRKRRVVHHTVPGVVKHDQSLLLAMIPILSDFRPIASNDLLEASKIDVLLNENVHVVSS